MENEEEQLMRLQTENLNKIGIGDILKFQKYLSKVDPSTIPMILDLLAKGEAMLNTPEGKAFVEAAKAAARAILSK